MSDTLEIAQIETLTPATVFHRDGGVEDVISKLEAEVRAIEIDVSSEKGRKHCASVAHRVARSKTLLDDMGKQVQADAKAIVDKVNGDRRVIRERLDLLKADVRKSLDDYEAFQEQRIDGHKDAIREIEALARFDIEPTEDLVAQRLEALTAFAQRDFQEFSARATQAVDTVRDMLNGYAREAIDRRVEAGREAERALKEAEEASALAEQQRIAREAEIARQAAEDARLKAEAEAERKRLVAEAEVKRQQEAAAAEQRRIENERQAAIQRAEQAERARIAAQEEAVRREKAAADKAEQDKMDAIEDERRRVAQTAEDARAEQARREANKAHRAKLNNEALKSLMSILSEDDAKAVITIVARGEVPHMVINY